MARRPTPRRAALLLTILLAVPAAPPAHAAAPACGRAAAAKAGRWYTAAPPLPAHSTAYQALHGDLRRLRTVALAPADPRVVLATDGEHVQRSDDAGCTWRQVYALPDGAAPSRDLDMITAVDVGRDGQVLLAVEPTGNGPTVGGLTYVVHSADGRTGWSATRVGFGGVFDPAAGPSAPVVHTGARGVTYLAFVESGAVRYVRSTDGGATWTSPGNVGPDDPVGLVGFAVSPWDADELWEWGGTTSRTRGTLTGLRHSTDGARTWASVDPWPRFGAGPPDWRSADIAWPRRGGPARVLVLGATDDQVGKTPPPTASWSGDDGRTWTQVTLAPHTASLRDAAITHTANGDAVVATASGVVYLVPYRGRVPRETEWRRLAALPARTDAEWSAMGYDRARATATSPGVVAVPSWTTVDLLTVPR